MVTAVKVVMPESLAMAEGKVFMPETLAMTEATAPAINIAPPRIVGVSPCRAIIAAEMSGCPVNGMAATPAAAAMSHIHGDSATALKACSTTAHEVTAATSTETTAMEAATATWYIDAATTPAKASTPAEAAATAPRFGNGYSDYEP
jgi:hypothetical protein